tara:strand:+ start:330 stop:710 length:381 start_codon:yes stop_codon:yes gene_type:complete
MSLKRNDYLAFIPVFSIATLSWFFTMLVLNKFKRPIRLKKYQLFALGVSLVGGVGAWTAEVSVRESELMTLQILASTFRSFSSWLSLLILVNDSVRLSTQQLLSIIPRVIITILWEIQHRLVLSPQ